MTMHSLFADYSFRLLRLMSVAGAVLLMVSTATTQRAEALSPVNPGAFANKASANATIIEVRGGHGGGGGGGGGGGHGVSGGGHGVSGGGHGVSGAGVPSGSFSAGPAIASGGTRVGTFAGRSAFVGHGFHHRFRHHHGFFVGGIYYDDYPYYYDYPYIDYPAVIAVPGCRIIPTIYGPRPVCTRTARHHSHHRRHTHRRHHRA